MTKVSCNCIICANEFDPNELQNTALSRVNITNFKVCQGCFDKSDPAEDYRQVRDIVYSYLHFAQAKRQFDEAQDILDTRKK